MTAHEETPSKILAFEELLQRAHSLLSEEERALADLRKGGQKWAEIAATLGEQPDAVRKRFERAMDRVCRELGIGIDDE